MSQSQEKQAFSGQDCAPIQSIGNYFSTKDRLLVIPPWQREYVWQVGENQAVGELLSDLKDFLEIDGKEYWIGSVILCEEPAGSKQFWLIDGQQRSLTLLIFIMAAKKYMTNAKLLDGTNIRHARLLTLCSDCISGAVGAYLPRITMDRSKADSILQSIFLWSGLADNESARELLEDKDSWTQTQKNLANVAEWIYEEKFKKSWIDDSKIVESIEKILNSVNVVELHLPSVQDALTVFDRINNRGADLSSSDLIKNQIFQHEEDSAFTEITENWRAMKKNLNEASINRLKDPTYLLRSIAIARQGHEAQLLGDIHKQGHKITYNELTKYWSDRLNPKHSEKNKVVPLTSGELVKELLLSSKRLANISNEKNSGTQKADLSDLYFTRYLKIVQHFPILLAGKDLSNNAFELLVKQVHARTAFYYLSGERTQQFENVVPEWTFDISKLGKNADVKEISKIYQKYAMVEKDFTELEQSMAAWSYKDGTEKRKIRAVLSQLSKTIDQLCGKELKNSPEAYFEVVKRNSKHGWDIDHIEARGKDPKDSLFHTMGNLVLLHPIDNRSKGKAKSADKIENYANCPLNLTKTLVGVKANPDKKKLERYFDSISVDYNFDLNNWSEAQIKKRTKFYFTLLREHLTVK